MTHFGLDLVRIDMQCYGIIADQFLSPLGTFRHPHPVPVVGGFGNYHPRINRHRAKSLPGCSPR